MRASAAAALLCLLGCGDLPPYELTISVATPEGEARVSLVVDGVEVPAQPGGGFVIERDYADEDAAAQAPPVVLEVFLDGVLSDAIERAPHVCSEERERGRCGPITSAWLSLCVTADGAFGGLCGGLSCSDETGPCGGYIAGPPR